MNEEWGAGTMDNGRGVKWGEGQQSMAVINRMEPDWKQPLSLRGTISNPGNTAGVTALDMTGGHNNRAERRGRGGDGREGEERSGETVFPPTRS